MSLIHLHQNIGFASAELILPTSKSLSNRALIIQSLCPQQFQIDRLSDAEDTEILKNILRQPQTVYDVNAAGTSMRFLVSLLSVTSGHFTLTGSARMKERPIGKLVEALRELGADIEYLEKEGFPPLKIRGNKLDGGKLSIDGSISSQFISSLLLIAPCLTHGLELEISGKMVSAPYVDMTLSLMEYFGVRHSRNGQKIIIAPQNYQPRNYVVEADWSAAGFWYGHIANTKPGSSIRFPNLSLNSMQGDKKTAHYFTLLGVDTKESNLGITIEKTDRPIAVVEIDLINEPDLFPAFAFACATAKVKARFTGLDTLNLKESKRIEAIKTELEKTGALVKATQHSFELCDFNPWPSSILFNTYDDHRLAMAASIFAQSGVPTTVENAQVVAKSYPAFWEDLQSSAIII